MSPVDQQNASFAATIESELPPVCKTQQALMQFIIDNVDVVRALTLTTKQLNLFKFVKTRGKVFSIDVAAQFSISLANASSSLQGLFKLGYLKREELSHETGGIHYCYSVAI